MTEPEDGQYAWSDPLLTEGVTETDSDRAAHAVRQAIKDVPHLARSILLLQLAGEQIGEMAASLPTPITVEDLHKVYEPRVQEMFEDAISIAQHRRGTSD